MKKIITIGLISLMLFSMTGCDSIENNQSENEVSNDIEITTDSAVEYVENPVIVDVEESLNEGGSDLEDTVNLIGDNIDNSIDIVDDSVDVIGNSENIESNSSETLQIVNPIKSYDTIEEAVKVAGFDMKDLQLEGYELSDISVISTEENKTIELLYWSEDSKVCVRKSNVPTNNSGNYNNYTNIVSEPIEGQEANVMYFGNENAFDYVFFVIDNYGYTIAVSTVNGVGVPQETLKNYMELCR